MNTQQKTERTQSGKTYWIRHVASVNHADKLAEALREVLRALPPRYEHTIATGMMALADYEEAKQ